MDDPFAPTPAPKIELLLGENPLSAPTNAQNSLAPHREFILESRQAIARSDGTLKKPASASYARRMQGERQIFWLVTRIPVLLILGWFTVSHLALGSDWVFIDGVNLLFHEAGHWIFAFGGDTLTVLGGSLLQVLIPAVLVLYFVYWQEERFSAVVCAWWVGENFLNVARYMHDAPVEELPLVGGDTHDWKWLFEHWDILRQARDVADVVRIAGIAVMVTALAYLLWMTIRPKEKDITDNFNLPST